MAINLNGVAIEDINFDGVALDVINLDGVEVWRRETEHPEYKVWSSVNMTSFQEQTNNCGNPATINNTTMFISSRSNGKIHKATAAPLPSEEWALEKGTQSDFTAYASHLHMGILHNNEWVYGAFAGTSGDTLYLYKNENISSPYSIYTNGSGGSIPIQSTSANGGLTYFGNYPIFFISDKTETTFYYCRSTGSYISLYSISGLMNVHRAIADGSGAYAVGLAGIGNTINHIAIYKPTYSNRGGTEIASFYFDDAHTSYDSNRTFDVNFCKEGEYLYISYKSALREEQKILKYSILEKTFEVIYEEQYTGFLLGDIEYINGKLLCSFGGPKIICVNLETGQTSPIELPSNVMSLGNAYYDNEVWKIIAATGYWNSAGNYVAYELVPWDYEPPTQYYTLTMTYNADQGSIEVSPAPNEDGKYKENTEITITVTAADGYQIKTITVNGTVLETGVTSYQFVIQQDSTVEAEFEEFYDPNWHKVVEQTPWALITGQEPVHSSIMGRYFAIDNTLYCAEGGGVDDQILTRYIYNSTDNTWSAENQTFSLRESSPYNGVYTINSNLLSTKGAFRDSMINIPVFGYALDQINISRNNQANGIVYANGSSEGGGLVLENANPKTQFMDYLSCVVAPNNNLYLIETSVNQADTTSYANRGIYWIAPTSASDSTPVRKSVTVPNFAYFSGPHDSLVTSNKVYMAFADGTVNQQGSVWMIDFDYTSADGENPNAQTLAASTTTQNACCGLKMCETNDGTIWMLITHKSAVAQLYKWDKTSQSPQFVSEYPYATDTEKTNQYNQQPTIVADKNLLVCAITGNGNNGYVFNPKYGEWTKIDGLEGVYALSAISETGEFIGVGLEQDVATLYHIKDGDPVVDPYPVPDTPYDGDFSFNFISNYENSSNVRLDSYLNNGSTTTVYSLSYDNAVVQVEVLRNGQKVDNIPVELEIISTSSSGTQYITSKNLGNNTFELIPYRTVNRAQTVKFKLSSSYVQNGYEQTYSMRSLSV